MDDLEDYASPFEKQPQIIPDTYGPVKFLGLDVSMFGSFISSPFFKIKEKALDKSISFENRCQAIRYMQRISHKDRFKHCMECILELIKEPSFPLPHRFFFFSNAQKYIRLDADLVQQTHVWFFDHASELNCPLSYKIMSAKYILSQVEVPNRNMYHQFLASIATNQEMEICYRADCADALKNLSWTEEMKEIGNKVIDELGSLYEENKIQSIYNNAQNIHSESIQQKTNESLRMLISEQYNTRDSCSTDIIFQELSKHPKKIILQKVFYRLMTDPSKFENCLLMDIMKMVWNKISVSSQKATLIQRMMEEMIDMDAGGCSSGYCTRLLNVLSGFYDNYSPVKITYKEQLRNQIFAHFDTSRKLLNKNEQEMLVLELVSKEKKFIDEFIFSYSPKKDFEKEFVQTGNVSKEDFSLIFSQSLKEYFGLDETEVKKYNT